MESLLNHFWIALETGPTKIVYCLSTGCLVGLESEDGSAVSTRDLSRTDRAAVYSKVQEYSDKAEFEVNRLARLG